MIMSAFSLHLSWVTKMHARHRILCSILYRDTLFAGGNERCVNRLHDLEAAKSVQPYRHAHHAHEWCMTGQVCGMHVSLKTNRGGGGGGARRPSLSLV